jgi:hypothetical protein
MTIDLDELKRVIDDLLTALSTKARTMEVDADFYWDVPKLKRYDQYDKPEELTIGQLSDDWDELTRILQGKSAPVPYALVWAASILRRIGEQTRA